MKFSTKDSFNKCDKIRMILIIWSHLLKKSFMKNFIFLCSLSLETKEWKYRENSRKIHIKDIKKSNLHGPGKY